MNGLPSIIIGLFIFGLIVEATHKQSGFAGSVALAIIMLPIIARGTQEVLLLVPANLREAADALGVSRWRTVLGVILPSAIGGILTATVLAVARAAGETAPFILLDSVFDGSEVSLNPFEAVPNIPTTIFRLSEEASPTGFAQAWGAGLVLLVFIMVSSLLRPHAACPDPKEDGAMSIESTEFSQIVAAARAGCGSRRGPWRMPASPPGGRVSCRSSRSSRLRTYPSSTARSRRCTGSPCASSAAGSRR